MIHMLSASSSYLHATGGRPAAHTDAVGGATDLAHQHARLRRVTEDAKENAYTVYSYVFMHMIT